MHNDIKATLKKIVTRSVNIDIDAEKLANVDTAFEASGKSQLRVPKESDDRTFLLVSTFEIQAQKGSDIFHASIVAEFYFELDAQTGEYDDIIRKQCLPIVQNEIASIANKVLSGMGYPEFLHIH